MRTSIFLAFCFLVISLPLQAAQDSVRFATFNASLNRFNAGDLATELSAPGSAQPDTIAEIIQWVRPDVLLINEFDFDAGSLAAQGFQDNYLSIAHGDAEPIFYPYHFVAPSNTGIPSGFDLDNNGSVGGPNDAFGFGFFPGQFGMVVYSMFPIDFDAIRTFQLFLWKDMPDALLPDDPAFPGLADWYSPEELAVFRLSSKSHWDIPIVFPGDDEPKTVHFLVSHPTPPVFDGSEDRNGTRNADEIRFWADYIMPSRSSYIYDDNGQTGGLPPGALFVIAGDQNSDPLDGDSIPGSAQQLLEHPFINTKVAPSSPGAVEQSALQGNANTLHLSDPAFDTADFFDGFPPSPFGGAPAICERTTFSRGNHSGSPMQRSSGPPVTIRCFRWLEPFRSRVPIIVWCGWTFRCQAPSKESVLAGSQSERISAGDEPRLLPFLGSIGRSQEQLEAFEFEVNLPDHEVVAPRHITFHTPSADCCHTRFLVTKFRFAIADSIGRRNTLIS